MTIFDIEIITCAIALIQITFRELFFRPLLLIKRIFRKLS